MPKPTTAPMHHQQLLQLLDAVLQPTVIKDYAPNGLQVEGRAEVQQIITGVTASQALLEVAVAEGADALLVHHGYFWDNQTPVVTGMQRQRLKTLLTHDISLLAYHLPLDIHPQLGNNVQLAQLLGIKVLGPMTSCQPLGIVVQGELASPLSGAAFADHLRLRLGRTPLHCNAAAVPLIRRIAWCTGGGQSYLLSAAQQGAEAFITGEVSEQTVHIAREMGVHFYAVGHHASERYGIKALGEWLAQQHGFSVRFIDIDNPA